MDVEELKSRAGMAKLLIDTLVAQGGLFEDLLKDLEKAEERRPAALVTIRDLPPEILLRIFRFLVTVSGGHGCASWQAQLMRTSLRLVCSEWNQLVLHDPSMWTAVFIDVEDVLDEIESLQDDCAIQSVTSGKKSSSFSIPKPLLDRIRQCMGRGKDLPKSLRLVFPDIDSMERFGRHRIDIDLFKCVRQQSSWESISIHFSDDLDGTNGQVTRSFRPTGLPSPVAWGMWSTVHTLELSMDMNTDEDLDWEEFDALGTIPQFEHETHDERFSSRPEFTLSAHACPALRVVSLQLSARNLLQWDLPWSQLTDLKLATFANRSTDYVNVLRHCAVLERLEIHVDLPNRQYSIPCSCCPFGIIQTTEALLPRLHTFILRVDVKCDMLPHLVARLRTPSLHTFSYENTFNRDSVDAEGYHEYFSLEVIQWLSVLIEESHCSVRSLTIQLFEATIHDYARFHRFFALLPELESLSLAGQRMTCEFLKRATLPSTLKTVSIQNICCSTTDPKPNFAEWAESWVGDARCAGEEDREAKLSAELVTVLEPYYKWDPEGVEAHRRKRAPRTLEKLWEKDIDVQIAYRL
ncbi:hypothetical protein NMY22_g19812 [Coprinellus aureogranulatus]|nr:hypothetical protein NMY22_g19812 [Coprinellus aureogranulatus]